MPCSDHGRGDDGRADKLARLLCRVMEDLETRHRRVYGDIVNYCPELLAWWTEHKEADAEVRAMLAENERRAVLRSQAMAKLTPEERAAL